VSAFDAAMVPESASRVGRGCGGSRGKCPETGTYWKTPFLWEPGSPEPLASSSLTFQVADEKWLESAVADVMSHSLDESDRFAVARHGAEHAVTHLMAMLPDYFERPEGWWHAGIDAEGNKVGFVLPVLFKDASQWKGRRPQGTIFYMGVLPPFRGHGYGLALVHHATRLFIEAGCWRILCDTGSDNLPMVSTFRRAGYHERSPWLRPIA